MSTCLKMCCAYKLIYIIVLIQSKLSQYSSKRIADSRCIQSKKTDFGLVQNGSVSESLKTLPKIITGFLSADKSGNEEVIRKNMNNCIDNPDCRLRIELDKKKEDSMTLCVVVNEAESCFVSTCTCPTYRSRRDIQSPVFTTPKSILKIQTASCQFEAISVENIHDIVPGNSANLEVLIQSKPLQSSSKRIADSRCNQSKKTDFGLVQNGSISESLKTLPNIITGFLSTNKPGNEEAIRWNLNKCICNPDCRLRIELDKKKEDSMTLCVVVREEESCFVSTCSCPTNRSRREIKSPVFTTPKPILGIQTPSCQFEVISSENTSDIIRLNSTNLIYEKTVECTTNESETTNRSLKNYVQGNRQPASGDNNWVYGFFIGFSIGTLLGVFATFLWFKRKSSMPKILSVVNGIYNSGGKTLDYKLYLHDVTEYSEISEPEQNDEHKLKYQDSAYHVSGAKAHASASFVVHTDTRERRIQKEDKDKQDPTNDGGLAQKPGLVPLNSSDKSEIQQEKETYVNNGYIFEQDIYLIPINMINANPDMCIEFPRDTNDMDKTDKEEKEIIMETHTEQMENIDSNLTYFVLSAIENKKSTVHEFTDCDDNSGENNPSKVKTEHATTGKRETGYYKEEHGQDSVNTYFELSKSS